MFCLLREKYFVGRQTVRRDNTEKKVSIPFDASLAIQREKRKSHLHFSRKGPDFFNFRDASLTLDKQIVEWLTQERIETGTEINILMVMTADDEGVLIIHSSCEISSGTNRSFWSALSWIEASAMIFLLFSSLMRNHFFWCLSKTHNRERAKLPYT